MTNKSNWALGHELLDKGNIPEAEKIFSVNADKIEADIFFYGKARLAFIQKKPLEAVKFLMSALKVNARYGPALVMLGDIYADTKQGLQAVEFYGRAVALKPDDPDPKQKLVWCLSGMTFKKMNPHLKAIIMECLEDKRLDLSLMGGAWLSIIENDPAFGNLYKYSKLKDYAAFKAAMDKNKSLDALVDPLFLTGLGQFTVANILFERWIVFLRRYILEHHTENLNKFSDPDFYTYIVCVLCRYAYWTDYVFAEIAEETQNIEKLEFKISENASVSLNDLALYGCYRPLSTLKHARNLAAQLEGGDHVSQILKTQIEVHFILEDLKKSVPVLFEIKDKVSKAVQEQYEDFPYPRYQAINSNIRHEEIEGRLRGKNAKILVAGCGTGREALELGAVFPDAKILAIDLSRTSLSYALMKQKELGIHNIDFKHADIMTLDQLEEKFDYICSSGVLHHLENPLAGWKILCNLLKDKGLMRIALYSEKARASINHARAVITENNIANNDEGIKNFRQNIENILPHYDRQTLWNLYDYYSLPECRDLLFHVQESQYTIDRISEELGVLGLKYLDFYIDSDVKHKVQKKYKKEYEKDALSAWKKWEQDNPMTFIGMYRFWCEKV